ncbi:MAG: hypothetical protein AAF560_27590 [Acidobacteriota bacterium]
MSSTPLDQNPENLLPALRDLKREVFSRPVTEAIKRSDAATREAFVAQRTELTESILRLETAQLSDIRKQLEAHGQSLEEGIAELTTSLKELEQAAQWAQGLGKVLSLVSKVIPVV